MMWFLLCDDVIDQQTYCLGVFKELSDLTKHVARTMYDVPERKLYCVNSGDQQYWLLKPNKYKGSCQTEVK